MASGRRELILLGTGTSTGVPVIGCHCAVCDSTDIRNHRTRTSVFVPAPDGNFLIDTPPDLRHQLLRERIDLIHAAVYTHSHADHIFGLDDLRICGFRLKQPIPLYCEENVEQQLRGAYHYAFTPPVHNNHLFAVPNLSFVRISNEPFEVLGQTLLPVRLMHGQLPVFGFRLKDVAFCTDVSLIPEESFPLLEGLEVLVIDALRDHPHPTHFSIGQSLEIVARLKPRQTYFTHISHSLDHEETNRRLPPGVSLAFDGLRIAF